MLELDAAVYTSSRAGLRYELAEPLRLERGTCLVLHGDNGAGKTTFLEEVFIPRIRAQACVIYLAQDMDLQQNTIRATLALMDIPVPPSLPDMVTAWVRAGGCRDVIILDEFDKYFCAGMPEGLDLTDFGWVVTVSHLGLPEAYRGFAAGMALHFERQTGTHVRLRTERLW